MENAVGIVADKLIKYFSFPEERRDVVAFGLTTLFLAVLDILGIAVAGFLTGLPGPTFAAAATFAFFRLLTGGAHFSGPLLCCVASSLLLSGCALFGGWLSAVMTPLSQIAFIAGVSFIAGAVTAAYAPVASPGKPLTDRRRVSLKRKALAFDTAWVVAAVSAICFDNSLVALASALGLLAQTITLTPGGARLFDLVDRTVGVTRLNKVKRGN